MIVEVTMNWAKWVLVVFYALALLSTIASIGKPRKPIDSGQAVFSVIFIGIMVALVLVA